MSQLPIPFLNQQESGTEELAGASPIAMNVVIDGRGAVKRRPGIGTTRLAPSGVIDATGIEALHRADNGQLYAVNAQRPAAHIYAVTPTAVHDISAAPGAFVRGGGRPIFAETELILLVAAGSDIQKIELSSRTSSLLGGNPPHASFVVANASRVLANDTEVNLTAIRYSDVAIGNTSFAGLETWQPAVGNTAGFFVAQARPDPVVAVYESTNEVFVFGTDTLQVFTPDPSLIYAPVASREYGCAAPYSVIKREQEFLWLDNQLRFVKSDGRSLSVIGGPIKGTIDAIAKTSTVADAYGYHVHHGSTDALCWTFPSDGRTFVYQVGAGWAQWSGWSDVGDHWAPFTALSSVLVNGTNENLVGTRDGRIGALDSANNTDFGTRINAYVETGFQDRGTDALKKCNVVRLAIRRGETRTSEPVGFLSFRDNLGPWESPFVIQFGAGGDSETSVIFRSVGMPYRRRQWRFQFDGTEDMVLVAATEEFDVLPN